jgi:hypothetical protein
MKVIKSGRLRWLEHLFRMQEQDPCSKLALHKPEGTGRVGRPAIRWLHSIEEDLKITGVRNWRRRHRIGTSGEQSWKRPRFTVDCSANRRRRTIITMEAFRDLGTIPLEMAKHWKALQFLPLHATRDMYFGPVFLSLSGAAEPPLPTFLVPAPPLTNSPQTFRLTTI